MISPEDFVRGEASREAFSKWIFLQELNEVYLLLDFISGRPDKHLIDLNRKIICIDPEDEQKTLEMPLCDVLRIVSALRYPPTETERKNEKHSPPTGTEPKNEKHSPPGERPGQQQGPQQGKTPQGSATTGATNRTAAQLAERIIDGPVELKAAFLLRLKDVLNNLTYPAKGSSVAYTTMFTEDPGKDNNQAMRLGAARLAFPNLYQHALIFRRLRDRLVFGGIILMMLAITLLWQVTYGIQVTSRYDEKNRAADNAARQLYADLEQTGENALETDLGTFCATRPVSASRSANPPSPPDKSSQIEARINVPKKIGPADIRQHCDTYLYEHQRLCGAIHDVLSLRDSAEFHVMEFLLPTAKTAGAPKPTERSACGDDNARQEDVQSTVGPLLAMSRYFLPILFGLVGAIASLVRNIQDKIMDSVLSPRDYTLCYIRLTLGVIASAGIGLFYDTQALPMSSLSAPAFSISPSGFAFLAGYGAEAFFRMLDGVLQRVFNLEPVGPRTPVKP